MLYFKNTELAETYHVSLRTVLNWIEATKEGRLNLELSTNNGRQYVTNTASNRAIIEKMVQDRKKYRNTRGLKLIRPKPEIYDVFSRQQLFDIIADLDIHREIQRQYNYFDGGAKYWDTYARHLATEQVPNLLTSTLKLFAINQSYIDDLVARHRRVNVIDIGAGNGLPVRGFLERLLSQNRLARYIAIDISPAMLEIARQNITDWFGDRIQFEGHALDINYDRFADLIADDYVREGSHDTVNLVLALGGTLENFRSPEGALKVIQGSMGREDFFIWVPKLDTSATRRLFHFNVKSSNDSNKSGFVSPNHRFVFDLLNIDDSLYEVETGFEEQEGERYLRVRMKVAMSIVFEFGDGTRTVEFNKGDAILLWRYRQQNTLEAIKRLDSQGFGVLQLSLTGEQEYMLTIARIKSD